MQQSDIEVFHSSLPVQIRFNDIDAFGHVNNATYQEYFDLGRMQYFRKAFNGQMFSKELSLLIASIKTDFLAPVQLQHTIEVRTKVHEIGNKSLKMLQHVIDTKTGELKATCLSVMVCIRNADNISEPIPQAWRDMFMEMESE